MDTMNLKVQKRTEMGKKSKELLKKSIIPAVMYGPGSDNVNLQVQKNEFIKIYEEAGNSRIIHLDIDNGKESADVIIHKVNYDPVKEMISHIDLFRFKEGQKMYAYVELEFVGEAKPVKELGAVLEKLMDGIDIRCLPKDLLNNVKVDLSQIKTIDDVIRVKDLPIPANIEVMHNQDDMVAMTSIMEEEHEKKPATEVAPAKPDEKKEEVKKEENK